MKTIEIVKEKLKGCGNNFKLYFNKHKKFIEVYCGSGIGDNYVLCPECKSFLSGMQTAIKKSLEFLLPTQKMKRESTFSYKIDERIIDLKNALKLLEENK